ncbi:DUF1684 domain-containing protein [Lysobacter sp. CFH 32150]|uniref:DUF1684 domain-containing protein n=1 Tax=Lysobacter sp. CFH 32150 TaxID=2927128 RepID=UPI001FA713B0|nr:DUF1684 domain-containing protein [Lysobacter sp. CFH 32150]MCI4567289.1 DUF1684 domain-containing protein [Lysobacter sp. CFH 32150]
MRNKVIVLLGCLMLSACKGDEGAEATRVSQAELAFASAQQTWRAERRASLLKPDGWTSLIGLHWIDQGSHYIGSDPDNGVRIGKGPAHLGMLVRGKDDDLRFIPESHAIVTLDGQPLSDGANLKSDADEGGPSAIGFDEGKGIATVIKRGDRYALRVKHADADSRTGFTRLEYWPGGRDWQIEGRFVAHPAGKTIPVVNIIGTTDEIKNPGVVEFQRDGKTYRLEALDEGEGELFLVFADRTSGHGSYGAGRYLYAPMPDAQGNVMLDFNHGYNPPCAFTAFATCPLPPPENRLDLAITAGEKAYEKTKH